MTKQEILRIATEQEAKLAQLRTERDEWKRAYVEKCASLKHWMGEWEVQATRITDQEEEIDTLEEAIETGDQEIDQLRIERDEWNDLAMEAQVQVSACRTARDRLMSCVRWFLGAEGEFPERKQGDPPYWFRTAFRETFPAEHDAALTQREGGEDGT